MNRPWRDIIDVPDIPWKNWEARFGADPQVFSGNSTPMAPPPQEEQRGTLGLGKPEKRRP